MFQSIIRRAENTVDAMVAKLAARVLVAVPLVVAVGFATAAATVKLIEIYGHAAGLSIMAGVFAVLTLVTMAVVGTGILGGDSGERAEEPQPQASEQSEQLAGQVDSLLTPELKSILGAAAPLALPAVTRVAVKNLHLILLMAIVVYILSRFGRSSRPEDEGEVAAEQAAAAAPPA